MPRRLRAVRRAPIAWMLVLAAALAACAAPEFRLDARFRPGETRSYRLVADADVVITAGAASTSEHSHLVARASIDVLSVTPQGTTIMLTITAQTLTRDGKRTTVPPPQQVGLNVAPDGRVTQVTSEGQDLSLDAADIEDLVPLIGPPVPGHRVHLGDRWNAKPVLPTPSASPSASPSPSPSVSPTPSNEEARLAALRVVDTYDCAIVAVSTRRPVVRNRLIGGQPLELDGVEFASTEIAFAFRLGFPVTVKSNSEARLHVAGGGAQGGSVDIATTTALTLLKRSV